MTPKQLRELRNRQVEPEIGNRLAAAFEITEQSQADCVRLTKFTPQYVSDMVRGRFHNISVDNAREFAEFFECAIEDLFPSREAVAS
jgi:transcriptional regulator with XRE-family HTH domain